jgi:hypothetical protein
MSEEKCEKCNRKNYLREYDSNGDSSDGEKSLPETMDSPYEGTITYCDRCVDEAKKAWWENEKNAYIYDDYGNTPDDPEFDG